MMSTELPNESCVTGAPGLRPPLLGDMAPLIERLRQQVVGWQGKRVSCGVASRQAFCSRTGFAGRRERRADVVLASHTAVELGHPRTESCCFVLATWHPGTVHDYAFTRVGPELAALGRSIRHPIAQVVLLHLRPGAPPDPFGLDTTQFLINRLPGYMVRSVPGRLWVRVAESALQRGLSFADVATALMLAYHDEFPEVIGVEVLLMSQGPERIRSLSPIATEASILAGRHKKLVLQPDGDVECADLSCDGCDEKPTCDALRDVVVRRRRSR